MKHNWKNILDKPRYKGKGPGIWCPICNQAIEAENNDVLEIIKETNKVCKPAIQIGKVSRRYRRCSFCNLVFCDCHQFGPIRWVFWHRGGEYLIKVKVFNYEKKIVHFKSSKQVDLSLFA